MEYQPSFFFFSDFKVSTDFGQPAAPVSLERVDLTAYNYGNAVAVARIYRKLGQPAKAEEFDRLAAKIRLGSSGKDVAARNSSSSSRCGRSDKAVADVKEVIGVYPFYFGMVPWGKGYERAWSSIIDPAAVLDEVAGGVGFAGVPGLFTEELAGRRPGCGLHVERPDLAARQLSGDDRDGPDPARDQGPQGLDLAA